MHMQKLSLFALLLASFSVWAEIPLTQADLVGTWQIEKESTNKDGSQGRTTNTIWNVKNDGTIEGVTQDSDAHARVNSTKAVLNYSIENGKLIKQAAPGRSKMETCEAIEKNGNQMVLKCQTVYFFMSKK